MESGGGVSTERERWEYAGVFYSAEPTEEIVSTEHGEFTEEQGAPTLTWFVRRSTANLEDREESWLS
jgi:hypothetical protein